MRWFIYSSVLSVALFKNLLFSKVWWQAATLFYLFYIKHTYNI